MRLRDPVGRLRALARRPERPPHRNLATVGAAQVAGRAFDRRRVAPGDPSRRSAGWTRRGSILPGPGGPRLSAPTDRRGRPADRAREAGLGPWGRAVREFARLETTTGFGQVRHGESPPSGGGGRRACDLEESLQRLRIARARGRLRACIPSRCAHASLRMHPCAHASLAGYRLGVQKSGKIKWNGRSLQLKQPVAQATHQHGHRVR